MRDALDAKFDGLYADMLAVLTAAAIPKGKPLLAQAFAAYDRQRILEVLEVLAVVHLTLVGWSAADEYIAGLVKVNLRAAGES